MGGGRVNNLKNELYSFSYEDLSSEKLLETEADDGVCGCAWEKKEGAHMQFSAEQNFVLVSIIVTVWSVHSQLLSRSAHCKVQKAKSKKQSRRVLCMLWGLLLIFEETCYHIYRAAGNLATPAALFNATWLWRR